MATKTHKELVEQAMMRYFITLATSDRAEILKDINIEYGSFLAAIRIAMEEEQSLPDGEQLSKRLRQVRVNVKTPRLGKKGRLFALRHWSESRKLREQGASYQEIAEYLKVYRKFQVSTGYLKRLIEGLE